MIISSKKKKKQNRRDGKRHKWNIIERRCIIGSGYFLCIFLNTDFGVMNHNNIVKKKKESNMECNFYISVDSPSIQKFKSYKP
jgi:hypothetical protein